MFQRHDGWRHTSHEASPRQVGGTDANSLGTLGRKAYKISYKPYSVIDTGHLFHNIGNPAVIAGGIRAERLTWLGGFCKIENADSKMAGGPANCCEREKLCNNEAFKTQAEGFEVTQALPAVCTCCQAVYTASMTST